VSGSKQNKPEYARLMLCLNNDVARSSQVSSAQCFGPTPFSEHFRLWRRRSELAWSDECQVSKESENDSAWRQVRFELPSDSLNH
jgi:hypothetical protein